MITHKIVSKEKWPLFRIISNQLALIFSGDVCALHIPGSTVDTCLEVGHGILCNILPVALLPQKRELGICGRLWSN